MPLINKIGQVQRIEEKVIVEVDVNYRKALKDIEKFSHIHIFCVANKEIFFPIIGSVTSVNIKNGILELGECRCAINIEETNLELIDIKPYLPSEDYANSVSNAGNNVCINTIADQTVGVYHIPYAGEIRNTHGVTYIQYNDECEMPKEFTEYARVIWWFDKYDKKECRRILQCDTPYEHDGKLGVFSCRAPVRPNPVALTVVKVLKIEKDKKRVYISGIESFDHTPFLGIIDYDSKIDAIEKDDIRLPEWTKGWPDRIHVENYDDIKQGVDEEIEKIDNCVNKDIFFQVHDLKDTENEEKIENPVPTCITVKGASENNLKRISVSIPYGKITAVVGVSGSGKSSLVMDTIYAECARRMEYLNAENSMRVRPKIDSMDGCIPTVLISQKDIRGNVNSTIGTYCGINDHLRAIYAAIGKNNYENPNKVKMKLSASTFSFLDSECRCQTCNGSGKVFMPDIEKIIAYPEKSLLEGASPFLGKLKTFIENPNANWMKGQVVALATEYGVDLRKSWKKLPQDFRDDVIYGDENRTVTFSYNNKKNGRTGDITRKVEGIIPIINRLYTEENHGGMTEKFMSEKPCDVCHGERLAPEGRLATVLGVRYPMVISRDFREIKAFASHMKQELPEDEKQLIIEHIDAMISICDTAIRIGIDYLELNRRTEMISGGEAQRLKLLSAFGNHMTGILYIFDEPSKKLSEQEYHYIIEMMQELIHEGNTILMVEHNIDMIKAADYVIEIGPKAGEMGGYLIAEGTMHDLMICKDSMLCKYAGNAHQYDRSGRNINGISEYVDVQNVSVNNLKNVSVSIPKNAFTCITGVSGSGKSTLMYQGIMPQMSMNSDFTQVILVESKISGSLSRSVVATYTGLMDEIRLQYSKIDKVVEAGYTEKDFSFNTGKLRCEHCKGDGRIKIPYTEDSYGTCPVCRGKRYIREATEFLWNGKNITEVLEMSVAEAADFLEYYAPSLAKKCKMLSRVGLSYIKLGQSISTLSGGEAARLKIACCLMKAGMKNVLFLLDEPTCGLHFSDIDNLILLLYELIDFGNTVVAIEHNKRFLSAADYIITMGPGSGENGGKILSANKLED